jgi:hypothetical protein
MVMIHSSHACRVQAALQGQRAASADLENVRKIAAKAVIAWNNEAELAEAQERRQRITSDFEGLGSQGETLNELPENCRKPDADELLDHALLTGMSENPDREEVAPG